MTQTVNAANSTKKLPPGDLSTLPIDDVYVLLESNPAGISSKIVVRKQEQFGLNTIAEKHPKSPILRFFSTITDIFSILLFFASALAFLGQSPELAIAILVIIFINAAFTLYQERQAEQEMRSLRTWIPDQAKVIRDGNLQKIDVKEIVPGDIIVLEEGDRVPADARLIESYGITSIEIPLTGEFEPQPKTVTWQSPQEMEPTPIISNAEHESLVKESHALTAVNMVFMSTSIARGQGKAIVTATSMNTRFGQIAHLTQDIKPPQSPLQKEVTYFARYSFQLAFIIGGIFFLLGYFVLHLTILESLTFIVGVMIACVPEGLQATISSALAISVKKMAKKNVLVKRISAVQTLGSVTLICTDKTGTLTRGEMTVSKLWVSHKLIDVSGSGYHPKGEFKEAGRKIHRGEHKEVEHLMEISALCNNARLQPPEKDHESWRIVGDPTDGAMLVSAIKYGLNIAKLLKDQPISHVLPFDSDRKMMTTLHEAGNLIKAYSKGAPVKIIARCNEILVNGKLLPLTDVYKRSLHQVVERFAMEGLRVIAVASKDFFKTSITMDDPTFRDHVEANMTLVGIVAIKDPPRIEVRDAIKTAQEAGIKIAMITGDNAITAKSIAWEVGIISLDQWNNCVAITGDDLNKMADIQIAEAFQKPGAIFARITPDQKLRIVNVARASNEIVAVTGDGANDAPALRQSDIGIAMGLTGTDIAKESADIILTDDSFTSIVSGIESGRAIWLNLRNFIYFAFTHNWAELIPFVLFILIDTPIPLLPIHILMIDLCIDIVPSLALSRNPPEEGIMKIPPRSIKEHLFKPAVFLRSLVIGFTVGVIGFWLCINAWLEGGWQMGTALETTSPLYLKGVTMTYAAIVVGQVANLITCAKTREPFYRHDSKNNKLILYAVIWQFAILCLTIYIPFLQPIFGTSNLSIADWAYMLVIPVIILPVQELWRRGMIKKGNA
jgi:magnesium-transporting ATPase (P-type)